MLKGTVHQDGGAAFKVCVISRTAVFKNNIKSPGKLSPPWHQDGEYYPIKPLEVLTIWIPLDDVTPENGPMMFIPGSHKAHALYSHSWVDGDSKTINLVCDPEHFDAATATPLLLRAGQVSFHDVYMIHGSEANHTDKRRAAFIVRLMPATSFYDHALGAKTGKQHPAQGYGIRPLYLISGTDRASNNFDIGHGTT